MGDAQPSSDLDVKYTSNDPERGASVAIGQINHSPGLDSQPGSQASQAYGPAQNAFLSQLDMAQSSPPRSNAPYNMSTMANSLPQVPYRPGPYAPGSPQRFGPAIGAQPVMAQMSPMAQFAGQGAMPMPHQHYYMPQHPQLQQYYGGQVHPPQQTPGIHSRQNLGYYQNQMLVNHAQQTAVHPGYYYAQPGHFPAQGHPMQTAIAAGPYVTPQGTADSRLASQSPMNESGGPLPHGQPTASDGADSRQGVVRGPPRKPRQSGHAIWIGNLPPQTDLMSLVHHVCREAPGLESLFLISKSNCAFANFKDEATCASAQQKIHDSKFQSVRLVSRLRKSTVEGASGLPAPTGPSAVTAAAAASTESAAQNTATGAETSPAAGHTVDAKSGSSGEDTPQRDRFFILKSLTVEDLELSVRTGIWATQSHNEETLNNAFKAVDNVYLVFSANKSGEYFGYARMVSPIDDDPAAAIEFAPMAQSANDLDLPKAIPTEATEVAPKGRIIDDSARGTIFWEAEREGDESGDDEEESEAGSGQGQEQADGVDGIDGIDGVDGTPKAWGKPFKLEWLSTARLPFYRTRGLRNPWNSNREVKIARDGTELEPNVGRRLIGLFNRAQNPNAIPPGVHHGMVSGYPPMRAYPQ